MEETYQDTTGKNMPSKISVAMIDEIKSPADVITLKEKNWTWPSFLLVMVFIVVTVIVGTATPIAKDFSNLDQGARIGYIIAMFVGGCCGGAIIYDLGKHLFAHFTGYKLAYLCISGLCWDYSKQKKFSFDASLLLEFHSRFKPIDEKADRSPVLMSLGGFIVWLIVFATLLGIFASPIISNNVLKTVLITGTVLSASFPLYEVIPFRADYPTDMFVAVSTKKPEIREIYNAYYYNLGNEFSDVDYWIPSIDKYDNYWKAKIGIYVLRSQLYKADVNEAIKTITALHKAGKYLVDEEKGLISSERLFLLLLINDNAGADRLFISLPKNLKTEVLKHNCLAGYRNSLLVSGILRNKEDSTIDNINDFNKIFVKGATSERLQHEKKYFILSYNKVVKACPTFKLPTLNIDEPVANQNN